MKNRKLQVAWVMLGAAAVALLSSCGNHSTLEASSLPSVDGQLFKKLDDGLAFEVDRYYGAVLADWKEQAIPAAHSTIKVRGASPAQVSNSEEIQEGSYEGKDNVLLWQTKDVGWVEYEFEVSEDALYEIQVFYNPIKETGSKRPVQWDVLIDGERPFREASTASLYRTWKDVRPIVTNSDGDQIRPRSVDVSTWSKKPLIDSGGAYDHPLQWHLTPGKHTIRLIGYDPVAIDSLILQTPQQIPSYEEVREQYEAVPAIEGDPITIEAEQFTWKNDTAIKLFSDKDDRTVPRYTGRIIYNTVGGQRWLEQNQEITWTFEVPETGLYKLAFRALQNTIAQKTSFRTIKIDGQVPFEPFQAYGFPYSASWQGIELKDRSGTPYLVKLEKGEHTLSLAVTQSPVKPIIVDIEKLLAHLDAIDWDLRMVTGNKANSKRTLDRNRTWNMDQDFPGMTDKISVAAEAMEQLAVRAEQTNGKKDSISQGLHSSAKDLRSLLRKPEEIPYNIDQISSMREKLATFMDSLSKQALQLDELFIVPEKTSFPSMVADVFDRMWGTVQNFGYSFDTRDSLKEMDKRKLNIWVQRGRDYVDQLQQLADESFTPETGIEVKVNLLPNPELLLMSNAAGVQPDVALGLTQDLPVDYAIRGTLVDLSKQDGFDKLYSSYSPGSWLPLYYNGGYYGVPETQSFQVLYYRKDLLHRLKLNVPETWDDVYEMLPTLQQNDMNFYVNPKEYATYFYQHGVEFYEPGGLKTGLDTPEAYQSFKQWTNLFNTYALEREVPSFYQHFRDGSMPIGISDYNMYVQLSAAAPELNGRWGIALLPGVKQQDGTIVRWAGGGQRTGVIFQKSEKQEEAWKFLQWWLSTDVQTQYGSDLEAMNGVAFRWNTSNIEAFNNLPWKREDAAIILEQWKWYKDIPNVPGGYFLERELNNAWQRSVVQTANYMSSLEEAVRDIERELLRKQQEFGFADKNGHSIKPLDIPIVDQPWEGGGRNDK
ncbi:extracellular solute-binding protein [Paenibacillus xylaniclasticus]|uniref:extracellular solute-binding protein n=1 Tax=Paenibacillus xylaniclasticus TaxID=588083 RepID=UPI000FDB7258|nr:MULTISPECIES: extracellular solute-binding protein [Paenibacillus]GFN31727.1 ABC transporter substrate-binding protein [Paenibacillus curdlanolyticus]